jgi:hypothetical protein
MSPEQVDILALEDPIAPLERALIEEFLRREGYEPLMLNELLEPERHALLKNASTYASARLTEVESRAHFVHDIHGGDR